jgi:hypothetical protein
MNRPEQPIVTAHNVVPLIHYFVDVAQLSLERPRTVLNAHSVADLELRFYQTQSIPGDEYARRYRLKIYFL